MATEHRTVGRIIDILECAVRRPEGSTLAEFVKQLDAPRSTVHGFVNGLVARGYLAELTQGTYVLGPGAQSFISSSSTPIRTYVEPAMRKIAVATGETVTLAVPMGSSLTYVHAIKSPRRIGYQPDLLVRRPWWPTSAGKIFLATGVVGGNIADVKVSLKRERIEFEEEIENVRIRQYATNVGETEADVAAVAVAVTYGGETIGSVTVGGPRHRVEPFLADYSAVCLSSVQDIEH